MPFWASITFSHQECHHYDLFTIKFYKKYLNPKFKKLKSGCNQKGGDPKSNWTPLTQPNKIKRHFRPIQTHTHNTLTSAIHIQKRWCSTCLALIEKHHNTRCIVPHWTFILTTFTHTNHQNQIPLSRYSQFSLYRSSDSTSSHSSFLLVLQHLHSILPINLRSEASSS